MLKPQIEQYYRHERRDPRLGRTLWLDPRSLAHMIENDIHAMASRYEDKAWDRKTAILDQGALGSCTGNAGTGALGTEPFYSELADLHLQLDEAFAVKLYSDATKIDPFVGTYPPEDTGSSGLAICKVLRGRMTIDKYRWARTPYGLLRLLQDAPVLIGMPWHNAFFNPNGSGFIDAAPNWVGSGVAGWHEVVIRECEIDPIDVFSTVLTLDNSWGSGWGDHGSFRMRLRTYEQMSYVDLKQFIVN
jgi:hypothetical protein